jgi:hypothetical protein
MRLRVPGLLLALSATVLLAAVPAEAKKFRYASGPAPSPDTGMAVAEVELEPVGTGSGPKVAPSNLQLAVMVANTAVGRALSSAPLDSGMHVVLTPAESHPLNFVLERAALRTLTRRGVTAAVRRTVLPDDSVAVVGAGDPVLEYQLATARITYVRLIGGYLLPSRVKVERQALVEGSFTLRDPAGGRVLWTGEAAYNLVDRFPRSQLALVEDERYGDLKGVVPERSLGNYIEPVIVVAVVAGLIVLFFQNRP